MSDGAVVVGWTESQDQNAKGTTSGCHQVGEDLAVESVAVPFLQVVIQFQRSLLDGIGYHPISALHASFVFFFGLCG